MSNHDNTSTKDSPVIRRGRPCSYNSFDLYVPNLFYHRPVYFQLMYNVEYYCKSDINIHCSSCRETYNIHGLYEKKSLHVWACNHLSSTTNTRCVTAGVFESVIEKSFSTGTESVDDSQQNLFIPSHIITNHAFSTFAKRLSSFKESVNNRHLLAVNGLFATVANFTNGVIRQQSTTVRCAFCSILSSINSTLLIGPHVNIHKNYNVQCKYAELNYVYITRCVSDVSTSPIFTLVDPRTLTPVIQRIQTTPKSVVVRIAPTAPVKKRKLKYAADEEYDGDDGIAQKSISKRKKKKLDGAVARCKTTLPVGILPTLVEPSRPPPQQLRNMSTIDHGSGQIRYLIQPNSMYYQLTPVMKSYNSLERFKEYLDCK